MWVICQLEWVKASPAQSMIKVMSFYATDLVVCVESSVIGRQIVLVSERLNWSCYIEKKLQMFSVI